VRRLLFRVAIAAGIMAAWVLILRPSGMTGSMAFIAGCLVMAVILVFDMMLTGARD